MSKEQAAELVRHVSGMSLISGILLILLGLVAIAAPLDTSVLAIKVIAGVMVLGGIAHFVHSWESEGLGRLLWALLVACLYVAAGLWVWSHPLAGVVSMALVLGFVFVAEGVMALVAYALDRPVVRSEWLLVNGALSLILGLMIINRWPSNALWVIGALVGVNLLVTGVSRLMMAVSARRVARKIAA
jgi:uncharacterized membrane protein HdeD (DUF308 family)